MNIKQAVLLIISVMSLASCGKQVIPASGVELGKEYYPIQVGHFIEYAVDSIKYNDFNKSIDTISYELRDEITSEFQDDQGRASFLVTQYKRMTPNEGWLNNMTYYITPTDFNIEIIENNIRFVKLVYPVKTNTKWDGNVYVASQTPELSWYHNWVYSYTNINEEYHTGYIHFPSTVTVNEANEYAGDSTNNLYSTRTFSRERYAKNVGLISREIVNWEYQENIKFRKGFILVYRAKSYN
ncbi:MAG: hypothetical protein IT215_03060 [Chitinophagaceae bacterium]|nr:hypothetical protein [Chitinophagaceae bacterium]HMN33379.1 hypothetical protein [Chitinophagaceae bacterium]